MKALIKIIILAAILAVSSCGSEEGGWKSVGPATATGDVKALMTSADALYINADTAEKVKTALEAYEKILTIEPANFEALSRAGEFAFLYSYIYAADVKVKDEYYTKSIKYCERAMYTNPDFKALVDKGSLSATRLLFLQKEKLFLFSIDIALMGSAGKSALALSPSL